MEEPGVQRKRHRQTENTAAHSRKWIPLFFITFGCFCVVQALNMYLRVGMERKNREILEERDSLKQKLQDIGMESKNREILEERDSLKQKLQDIDSSRVAFFAAFHLATLEGSHGPFNVNKAIKYKQVLTNVGNGYNATTGVFTAPVRGLYVFHFTMFHDVAASYRRYKAIAILKKNEMSLAVAYDRANSDTHDSSTRVAVVTLEVGDSVYVELEKDSLFYDYRGDHNSFSGFLLFPM